MTVDSSEWFAASHFSRRMVLFFRGFSFLPILAVELPAVDASIVAASFFNLLIRLLTGSR